MKAQKTKKSGQGGSGMFHDDPDDVMHSATYGMEVSRQGKDKGARVRATKDVTVIDEGKKVRATAVKDPIDRIYEAGNISDHALAALRLFQKEFDRCGYAHFAKMNMNGGGGGGGSGMEEVFAKSQLSRDYVHNVFRLLGGVDSDMAKVMFWSVGLGRSFDKIVTVGGDSKHYWRGMFYAAVIVMEQDYVRMCQGNRRTIRSQGYTV